MIPLWCKNSNMSFASWGVCWCLPFGTVVALSVPFSSISEYSITCAFVAKLSSYWLLQASPQRNTKERVFKSWTNSSSSVISASHDQTWKKGWNKFLYKLNHMVRSGLAWQERSKGQEHKSHRNMMHCSLYQNLSHVIELPKRTGFDDTTAPD